MATLLKSVWVIAMVLLPISLAYAWNAFHEYAEQYGFETDMFIVTLLVTIVCGTLGVLGIYKMFQEIK